MFSLSNMIIQSSIIQVNNTTFPHSAYAPIVDGNAAATNLDRFIYTAMNAVYQGAIVFTSKNIGAKKHHRVYRVLYVSLGLVIAIGAGFSALIYLLREPLLRLYGVVPGAADSLGHATFVAAAYYAGWKKQLLSWSFPSPAHVSYVCSGS